ncbi:putative membrane protein [Helicobacter pylori NQ4099]|uniref:Putative membrane protein n=1 Tax=Helicobacter pylori NQ4099 TaxID=992026 RepID=J0IY82_HELPX|nr:putative membrane protein [Helicobacter pylori NQ4099]
MLVLVLDFLNSYVCIFWFLFLCVLKVFYCLWFVVVVLEFYLLLLGF